MSARKKRRKCPSCGGGFLKGKRVLRITVDGVHRQTVCKSCAGMAALILASDAPAICAHCHTNLAQYCAGCVGHVIDEAAGLNIAAELAKRLNGRAGQ